MRRLMFFAAALVLNSLPGSGQTNPTDSQTLQALLAEVRQMRQDLHATTVEMQRAQILVYRVQSQEAAVARAFQRWDVIRERLASVQADRRKMATQVHEDEVLLERSENQAQRKELEDAVTQSKARLDSWAAAEQEEQARESEAAEQLRLEQAKLAELQAQLDRLDKALEESSRQPLRNPR